MDWLKLFGLLVAVASVEILADGPKKKIRIHLPQKVKHIHHHKKIYITNHPAPPQYAPAFLPGVKGVAALPSNVPRPAYLPLNSVDMFEEPHARLPAVAPHASKLLPLYRARGHYGPTPAASDWDEQDYELAPPPDSADIYSSSGFSAPSAPASPSLPTKTKIKIVKVKSEDLPRKKTVRKVKPKRVILRSRPTPPPPPAPLSDDELPVSSFHEQFYADLEEAGTIRKIRKPPRIEKIIDGDTEHIHTYSEEHIHKIVFDDDSKVTGVVGVDPVGSMSALRAAHPLIPLKNTQTLVAIPTGAYSNLAVVGSMGTPSSLEYASYNPRDVTHDHIFHDHGEIPPGVDVNKEGFRVPPKVSYTSHGQKINGQSSKRYQGKRIHGKPTKPTPDFTYYESIFSHNQYRPKKKVKPTLPTYYDPSPSELTQFRPIPTKPRKTKTRNYGYKQQPQEFQLQQASVPAPFTVSSTVVHEYDTKNYPGASQTPSPAGFSKYKDHVIEFNDNYSNDFDYDVFASSSNIHTTEDKTDASLSLQGKSGKKSVSTQNISFGGQDRQTFVDHMAASGSSNTPVLSDPPAPTAREGTTGSDSATTTPYTIKETSPAHPYYTAMALQALQGGSEQADSSDNIPQFADPPTLPAEPTEATLPTTTTSQTLHFYKIQSTDAIPQPEYITETRISKKRREKNRDESRQLYNDMIKELMSDLEGDKPRTQNKHRGNPKTNVKYGDKI